MAAETDAQWVPIAVSSDILDGTVIPANLPTGPIAVWRSAKGHIYANGDRCPHRGMRLSHGFVRGETLSCIYHGWRFGTDGACRKIPAHPAVTPPKTIHCGPVAVTEVNGVVWSARSASGPAPSTPPIQIPGYTALRSLVFAAPLDAILATTQPQPHAHPQTEANDAPFKTDLAGHGVLLVANAYRSDETFIAVLVKDDLPLADRVAISGAAEILRRRVETEKATAS